MAASKISLPDELQQQLEQLAREQHRELAAVLEDAVRKYVEDRSWAQIFAYGRDCGEALGLVTEEAIDKAIAEYRREARRQ